MGTYGPKVIELLLGGLYTVLAAALAAGFRWARKKFRESKAEQDTIKQGIQALLRDRIIQAYNHYQDKGCCPIYGMQNVESMHKEYKALGGNGTVEKLVEELKNMPRTKKEEKTQ